MSNQKLDNLLTVSELSSIRYLAGKVCATEQGIRSQITQLKKGEKTTQEIGFELVEVTKSAVFLRLTDKKLEDFRLKINKFAKDNAPK